MFHWSNVSPEDLFRGLIYYLEFYLLCGSEDLPQNNFPKFDSCGLIITLIRFFLFIIHANYLKIFCDVINPFFIYYMKPISNNLAQYGICVNT